MLSWLSGVFWHLGKESSSLQGWSSCASGDSLQDISCCLAKLWLLGTGAVLTPGLQQCLEFVALTPGLWK